MMENILGNTNDSLPYSVQKILERYREPFRSLVRYYLEDVQVKRGTLTCDDAMKAVAHALEAEDEAANFIPDASIMEQAMEDYRAGRCIDAEDLFRGEI